MKRFNYVGGISGLIECNHGEYMLYADYEKEMIEMKKEIDRLNELINTVIPEVYQDKIGQQITEERARDWYNQYDNDPHAKDFVDYGIQHGYVIPTKKKTAVEQLKILINERKGRIHGSDYQLLLDRADAVIKELEADK